MAWPAAISAISGAVSAGSGIGGSIVSGVMGEKNLKFAKEQFDYQKKLNTQLLDRSDNQLSYMRRDAENANINPIAALSNGGNYAGLNQTSGPAPQYDTSSLLKAMEGINPLGIASGMQDLLTARSVQNLNEANTAKSVEEAGAIREQSNMLLQQAKQYEMLTKTMQHNLNFANRHSTAYGYVPNPYHLAGSHILDSFVPSSTNGIGNRFVNATLKEAEKLSNSGLIKNLSKSKDKSAKSKEHHFSDMPDYGSQIIP